MPQRIVALGARGTREEHASPAASALRGLPKYSRAAAS